LNDKNASVLESVRAVTYSAANFDASVQAMQTCLNYKIVGAGEISKPLASLWNAPAVAGKRYSVLAPESDESFYVRFIESPVTPGYEPLKTYGWNATEFLGQDVYALAKELETSPYTIIGGPRDLMENGAAIALQVHGPSDEVFYFTELNGRNFQKFYGVANCKVDRAFITILGVKDHAAGEITTISCTNAFLHRMTKSHFLHHIIPGGILWQLVGQFVQSVFDISY